MVDEGFPKFQIPVELDQKFDEQIQHLLNRSKYSLNVDRGTGLPFLQCTKSEEQDYWNPNNYRLTSKSENISYNKNKIFRNQYTLMQEMEDLSLPDINEYFDLFD